MEQRWLSHLKESRSGRQSHFKRAIRIHGKHSFDIFKLDCADSPESLDAKEALWIEFTRSTDRKFGYNLKLGGNQSRHSQETIEIIRKKLTGQKRTQETRKRISIAKRNISPETREKLRQANLGKNLSKETRNKLSAAIRGKKRSLETRKSQSLAKSRWWATASDAKKAEISKKMVENNPSSRPEIREKIRKTFTTRQISVGINNPMYGRKHRADSIEKMKGPRSGNYGGPKSDSHKKALILAWEKRRQNKSQGSIND